MINEKGGLAQLSQIKHQLFDISLFKADRKSAFIKNGCSTINRFNHFEWLAKL
jgi:hypothetical protein